MAFYRPEIISISSSESSSSESSDSQTEGWRDELKATIDAIETCGDFAVKKQYSQYANPGIQIGEHLIALPLDPAQVPLIRDASRQAPFGRGEKTLVDVSVRNTWELDASKFKLANPAWSEFMSNVLQDVSQSLGTSNVTTELYKLLLYEKDSFFKPHKDSEKAPEMIATLSICLPSRYQGGEVHLSHAGANRVFDTSQNIFDISGLAWYADVTHEIKPIREGHRLVLIYNIIQSGGSAASADFFTSQGQKLHNAVAQLNLQSSPPKRLLYFLDHKYSQTSLRIDHLKGRDRAVSLTLRDACTKNGWYLFLCNVTKRSSDEDYGYDEYDYDLDEDKGPILGMDTVATCNTEIFASAVELDCKDILGTDPYRRRDADSESEGEFTGNEGAAMEYRYHDSAVVIVPKAQLSQFFEYDADMRVLYDLVRDDLNAHPEDPATRRIALDFFKHAVKQESTLAPMVTELAWRMKEDSLFRATVSAGLNGAHNWGGVVHTLVKMIKNAPERPIDWDRSFGEFVKNHESLVRLSQSLDLAESLFEPGDLKTSFQQWRATIELLQFEKISSFNAKDHDSIMKLVGLHWEETDWVNNTLLQKIRDCTDRQLLSKIVCSLLQKSREGVLNGAQQVASVLLESCVPKLHLVKVTFNSPLPEYNGTIEYERFCHLVNSCLQSNLQKPIDELLRRSTGVIKSAPKDQASAIFEWHPEFSSKPILAEEMLQTICRDFEKNSMPPSEPAREFVIAVLKKYVIRNLPKCPRQLPGYSHEKRGCGRCEHCAELDEFLVSQHEQERVFVKGPVICKHLQERLPLNLFQRTQSSSTTAKQFCLRVVKLNKEHEVAVKDYMTQLRQVSKRLQPFRSEYLKQLLGSDAYGELVMLDKLPHSGEIIPESMDGAQAGQKRRARESVELPAPKR
ncbi:hypothetical protein F5Y08DRAFT_297962 [Xylaria arbuscula]|nr:hypothetical protein F5Y08DRAFT_297962 [Xylaria arbuscula]